MYAIRSYYVFMGKEHKLTDAGIDKIIQTLATPAMNAGLNRITSYNVCYTKLLREFITCVQSNAKACLLVKHITKENVYVSTH